MTNADDETQPAPKARRRFSFFLVAATLFLIFAGGLVTSMGAGLSVPDWPLSFGKVFPEMTGGVFYEHGHRMIATGVGTLCLILVIWLAIAERRAWVRNLGFWALAAVMAQGLLGGLTVLLGLPPPVSIMHGVLAQIFLALTIIIAYSQSEERAARAAAEGTMGTKLTSFGRRSLMLALLVFLQLIVAATMRHNRAGLAIPDFPLTAGSWLPFLDDSRLAWINAWREARHYAPVTMDQALLNLGHRALALALFAVSIAVLPSAKSVRAAFPAAWRTALATHLLIVFQIGLGAWTIWSEKQPHVTSLHVVMGAAILGSSVLLVLRALPVRLGRLFAPLETISSATDAADAESAAS